MKGKKTGGRQKGVKNRTTLEKEARHTEIVEQAKAEGVLPLEVMLHCMRKAWESNEFNEAHRYAVDAAPYIHAKLSAQKVEGGDVPLKTILEITWAPPSSANG
jgi:hypothetical protein